VRRSLPLGFLPIISVAVALAGCGGGDQAAAVRSTLDKFANATARQDYRTMCGLLSPALVRNVEQIGLPCEIALSRGLAGVRRPRLVVRSVTVSGDRATARVHTTAENQAPLDGTVGLERVGGSWRLSTLAAAGR
jgi:hypothetical protein